MKNEPFRLRAVESHDAFLLWQWANDETVRKASFSSGAIAWEEHQRWLENKLQDDNTVFYIVCDDRENLEIAQLRFDLARDLAIVSFSLAAPYRGRGYAWRIIKLASERVLATTGVRRINALIKCDNEASKKCFSKAGYKLIGTEACNGIPAEQWQLSAQ